jgi:urate oxidase
VADGIRLGVHRYGKAEVRLVRITRSTPRHELADLSVTSQLHGDFAATHLSGDNTGVLTTDAQKNTVYGLAKERGIESPEDFLLALSDHFVQSFDQVTGGRWTAEAYAWDRIAVDGQDHDHAFVRRGQEVRTAAVVRAGDGRWLLQGLTDLVVLKSTGSEFSGFPRDRFTTLAETTDRVLATSVTARWLLDVDDLHAVDTDALYHRVRTVLLETFAGVHSLSLQQTLFAMGRRVLQEHPELTEVRLSMPNRHHFLVDLTPFGLDNPGEVFFAADRPYGLIEAAVLRNGSADAHPAWGLLGSFC